MSIAAGASSGPEPVRTEEVGPPWQKLLWKAQPYPDNHVDASFLSELRTNGTCAARTDPQRRPHSPNLARLCCRHWGLYSRS